MNPAARHTHTTHTHLRKQTLALAASLARTSLGSDGSQPVPARVRVCYDPTAVHGAAPAARSHPVLLYRNR